MPHPPVTTQPTVTTRRERTSDQIAADRKAANAFFARYNNPTDTVQREVQRLLDRSAVDWNLLCCELEANWWAKTQPGNASRAVRRAARAARAAIAAAQQIPPRHDDRLRRYVHPVTTRLMPPASVTVLPTAERLASRGAADTFWKQSATPSAQYRTRVARDLETPFVQWLLMNPLYGPQHDAGEHYTGTLRRPVAQQYKKGRIRPAGMTYERALQIAIAALDILDSAD